MITQEKIIQSVHELPEPPKTCFQAISMLEDPKYTMEKVADFIIMDESVSLKLLQIANSAQYAGNSRTLTVRDAMMRIGVSNVKLILFQEVLEASKLKPTPFFIELWRSALYTAFFTKVIATKLGHPKPDLCFTAGLICDLGQLMINQFSTEFYKAFIDKVAANSMDVAKTEMAVLKFTHQDIGLTAANKWNMPTLYKTIIQYHHTPTAASHQLLKTDYTLMVAVHIANCLSPLFGPNGAKNIQLDAYEKLQGNSVSFDTLMATVEQARESVQANVDYFTQAMFGTSPAEDGSQQATAG